MKNTETKLVDTPKKFWANLILWRLALAMGMVEEGEKIAYIDVDEVLQQAEEQLRDYNTRT